MPPGALALARRLRGAALQGARLQADSSGESLGSSTLKNTSPLSPAALRSVSCACKSMPDCLATAK